MRLQLSKHHTLLLAAIMAAESSVATFPAIRAMDNQAATVASFSSNMVLLKSDA
jgi:uncharacterized protein (UPF0333 family)